MDRAKDLTLNGTEVLARIIRTGSPWRNPRHDATGQMVEHEKRDFPAQISHLSDWISDMNKTSRSDFGRFVTDKRREAGLTQHGLAQRLHVTDSAISKWERGLSYPDISLLSDIAVELDVSEQELIQASEDQEGRANKRDARTYRTWRRSILYSTLLTYGIAVVACLIVNLSVEHTLSWFWIVLAAVALAFCLTSLPLLPVPHPGWSSLAGAVISLGLLLVIVWSSSGSGSWLVITLMAVLFVLILIFGPIWLNLLDLPNGLGRHRTVVALAIDSVALILFLLVVLVSTGHPGSWADTAVPVSIIALVPVWIVALVIRYLPVNGLGRAAVVVAIFGLCVITIDRAVLLVVDESHDQVLDLGRWQPETIGANVQFLVFLGALAAAVVLGVAAASRRRRKKDIPDQ